MAEELVFFCVNSGPEAHHVYPNGDEVSNFEIVYLCRSYTGEPKNADGEMEELRFFAPEEIDLEMISPPIRPVLRRSLCFWFLLCLHRQLAAGAAHGDAGDRSLLLHDQVHDPVLHLGLDGPA